MKEPSVVHDTIVVKRTYRATPARIFRAWSVKEEMGWLGPGDVRWDTKILEQDFRIGGRRRMTFAAPGDVGYAEDCEYVDIVPDRRICFSETVKHGGVRISVSMVTIEFNPKGANAEVIVTEQATFLDGGDTPAGRRQGWAGTFAKLDDLMGGTIQ